MFHRFTKGARQVVATAVTEAERRGDRRLGTEHLLLGLLAEPASARLLGTDLDAGRAALHELDLSALRTVGIDAGDFHPTAPVRPGGRPRFTSAAKGALGLALRDAVGRGDRRLEPRHLLLALLGCARPDPAAEVLARLGVDPAAARARLREAA
jgi:ATP-dependent Clp protease ATP-binding subunit ClpA